MKKFVIIIILSFSFSYTQDKNPNNLSLMKSIVEIFNSNNYDQIYSMFNERLKNEVKSEIVLKFFSDVKGFHGKIKDFEFMKYDKGTSGEIAIGTLNFIKFSKSNFPVERYKIFFEREVLQLDLVVDNDQKIDAVITMFISEDNSLAYQWFFDEDKDGFTDIIGYDYNGDWILDGKISI